VKVSNPKGTQDFLPAAAIPRRYVVDTLVRIFERFGFEPLETPAFENLETLHGKYGEEGERLLFKILKRGEGGKAGEADLALRYDLTVPLARVVAQYPDLPRPFKRYQIAPVWRAEKPQRGRYREFWQCDVDVAGSTSGMVEIELLAMANEVYSSLGFEQFVIEINHRQLLTGLILAAGIPAEQEVSTLISLDKLDKIGRDGVVAELQGKGLSSDQLQALDTLLFDQLDAFMRARGLDEALMGHLASHLGDQPGGRKALDDLRALLTGLEHAGVPRDRVRLTPTLARGLGYYTGPIFEVTLANFASSVGGGGRYDNLVGMFSGRQVPACGISFGLDRILLMLQEENRLPVLATRTQVLVPFYSEAERDATLQLAADLRAAGLRVDVYPEPGRLGTQLQYGSARGIPFAAIQGPDELARGVVMVRNLANRAQLELTRKDVVAHLKAVQPEEPSRS